MSSDALSGLLKGAVAVFGSGAGLVGAGIAARKVYNACSGAGTLAGCTEDMVSLAREGRLQRGRVYGRDSLLSELCSMLGIDRGIVILQGEPGTGKSALVEELAHRIAEGKDSALKDVQILRLKASEIETKQGLMAQIHEMVDGSVQNLFSALITELGQNRTKQKRIFYIDEFHNLFRVPHNDMRYDFSVLDQHLAQLDENGIILLGATSDEGLVEAMRHYRPDLGKPFERRIRPIEVSKMSSKETIASLLNARDDLGKKKKVTLTEEGVKAIVLLASHAKLLGVFPDKAIKFFEAIVSNVGENGTIDSQAVCSYLAKVSHFQESAAYFEKIFRERSGEIEQQEIFFDRYFPMVETIEHSFSYDLAQSLMSCIDHSTFSRPFLVVQTNSYRFLEQSVTKMELPEGTNVRRLSVETLCNQFRGKPGSSAWLEDAFNKMGKDFLILEDTAPLIKFLEASAEPQRSFEVTKEAKQEGGEGSLLELAAHGIRTGIDALQQKSIDPIKQFTNQSIIPTLSEVEKAERTRNAIFSPLLDQLKRWIMAQNRCIIAVPPEMSQKALQVFQGQPLLKACPTTHSGSLPIADVIHWLESATNSSPYVKMVVMVVYNLWKNESLMLRSDLCFEVLRTINAPPFDAKAGIDSKILSEAVCNASKGMISAQQVAQFVERWKQLSRAPDVHRSLSEFSPALREFVDNCLINGSARMHIEEADRKKGSYIASLIRQYALAMKMEVINFSDLLKIPLSPELQEFCLESSHPSDLKKALVIVEQDDLSRVENLLQKFNERGVSVLCVGTPKASVKKERSVLSAFLGQASHLTSMVTTLLSNGHEGEKQQNVSWLESSFTRVEIPSFEKEPFRLFFDSQLDDLPKASKLSQEAKEALCLAFFSFTKWRDRPITLEQVVSALKSILETKILPSNKEDVVKCLYDKYGQSRGLSEDDIRYAIDPLLTPRLFRCSQLVRMVACKLFDSLRISLQFSASFLTNKVMCYAGTIVAVSTLLTLARRIIFGV